MVIILGIIFSVYILLQFLNLSKLVNVSPNMQNSFGIMRLLLTPFILIDTLLHEFSHMVGVILTGNKPMKIDIELDGSGLATYSVKQNASKISLSFIALLGYIGSSLISLFFVILIKDGLYTSMFNILAVIILYSIVITVIDTLKLPIKLNPILRIVVLIGLFISIELLLKLISPALMNFEFSMVSILVILGVSALLIAIGKFGLVWLIGLFVVVLKMIGSSNVSVYMEYLAVILLFASFANSMVILFLSLYQSGNGSDAEQLENLTGISKKVWGMVFFLVGLGVFIKGISLIYFS